MRLSPISAKSLLILWVLLFWTGPSLAQQATRLRLKSEPTVFPPLDKRDPSSRKRPDLQWYFKKYYGPAIKPRVDKQQVRVLEISTPDGESATYTYYVKQDKGLRVSVTFSQRMVAAEVLNQAFRSGPVIFTPAWSGSFTWTSQSTVVFEPDNPWRHGEERMGMIPTDVKSLHGGRLDAPFRWKLKLRSVYNIANKMLAWVPKKGDPQIVAILPREEGGFARNGVVYFIMDQVTPLAKLRRGVRILNVVEDKTQRPTFRLHYFKGTTFKTVDVEKRHVIGLTLSQRLPAGSEFTLQIDPGLVRQKQTQKGYEHPWTTRYEVPDMTLPKSVSCRYSDGCKVLATSRTFTFLVTKFKKRLYINYDAYLSSGAKLDKFVRINPKPKALTKSISGKSLVLNLTLVPDTVYQVRVSDKLPDSRGYHVGKPVAVTIRPANLPGVVALQSGQLSLESGGKHLLPLKIVNLKAVTVGVYPLGLDQLTTVLGQIVGGKAVDTAGLPTSLPQTITNPNKRNRWYEKGQIDLDKLLGKSGHNLALVQLERTTPGVELGSQRQRQLLVQITDVALSVKMLPEGAVVWATRLSNGTPVAGAAVTLFDTQMKLLAKGLTGADGIATLRPNEFEPDQDAVVICTHQKDTSYALHLAKKAIRPWYFKLMKPPKKRGRTVTADDRPTLAMVITDRGAYRPGETIRFKAFFRSRDGGRLVAPQSRKVTLKILNPKKEEVKSFTLTTNRFGSVAGEWRVDKSSKTGTFRLQAFFGVEKDYAAESRVIVTEFRKPAFRVLVTPKRKSFTRGEEVVASIGGRYFFGATMRKGKVTWTLYKRSGRFRPAGFKGFSFELVDVKADKDEFVSSGKGDLEEDGSFRLKQKLLTGESKTPFIYTLEGQIQDIDRQVVANRRSFLVHPGQVYVGVRLQDKFAYINKPLTLEAIAVTPKGKLVPNTPIEVTIYRRTFAWYTEWNADDYQYRTDPVDSQVHKCKAKKRGKAACRVVLKEPGLYIAKVQHKDKLGNTVHASREFNVIGRGEAGLGKHLYVRTELELDRSRYRAGETASVIVKNPFNSASALLTVERRGVLYKKFYTLKKGVHQLKVPVLSRYAPNVFVSVYLASGRSAKKRDAAGRDVGKATYLVGYAKLRVSRDTNRLKVEVTPDRKSVGPGESVTIDVAVRGMDGQGVPSEVALMVVDESVLSLTNHKTPKPLPQMYPESMIKLWLSDTRGVTRNKLVSFLNKGYQGGGGDDDDEKKEKDDDAPPKEVKVRKTFVNTLYWNPSLLTDGNGRARITVKLPDNLTTFRVMAVAIDSGTRFGAGQNEFLVTRPFLVRGALPRFVRVGDRVKAGVVAQNRTQRAMRTTVTLKASGLDVIGSTSKTVTILPGKNAEIAFTLSAPAVGRATLTFLAAAKGDRKTYRDNLQRTFEVQPVTIWEKFQLQGSTDGRKQIQIRYPGDAMTDGGSMEIELSSSLMGGLADGLDYLVKYPYGCVEQTTSSTYPLLSMIDLLPRLGYTKRPKAELMLFARAGIARFTRMETAAGGLSYWPGGTTPHIYGTAYAMLAINRAAKLKLSLPHGFRSRVTSWLEKQLRSTTLLADLRAHIIYVLTDAGKPQAAYASRLFDERDQLTLFGKGLLLMALVRTPGHTPLQLQTLVTAIKESLHPDGRILGGGTRDYYYFSSDLRKQAISLLALLSVAPGDPLVDALAQQILDRRFNGYWSSTQRTTYALMALTAYFKQRERNTVAPQFTVTLGGQTLSPAQMTKVSKLIYRYRFPLATVLKGGHKTLAITRLGGKGPLFYTLRTRYTTRPVQELDTVVQKNMVLYKQIETLQGKDLKGQQIPAGKLVRVRLFLYLPKTVNFLALNDPLPAGLEAVNTALSTSSKAKLSDVVDARPNSPLIYWAERTKRYISHQEFRDDRVLFFSDKLHSGLWEFTYLARATTRGQFTIPPAQVEAMYDPEFLARSELVKASVQ